MQELTLADCRAAARSVQDAEFGREAVALVRPRGSLGVLRRRGPLALVLYVAARDGRLIWRGPDSLALLQPPGDQALPAPDLRTGLARRLERGWETLIFMLPPAALLAGALLSGLIWLGTSWVPLVWVVLVLVLGAMLYVAVLLSCGLLSGVIGAVRAVTRPRPERMAAETLPGERWSMVLCHHMQAATAPRFLLHEVRQKLDDLIGVDLAEVAADRGVRVSDPQVTEELICLRAGVTTEEMRAEVAEWSERVGDGFTVRLSDYRAVREPVRIFDRGEFLFWYLAAEIAAVFLLARVVPDWELAACGDGCAGHPVTYGKAVRWLAQRLLLTDPYGLSPASWQTWAIGWLVSLMSATGVLVLVSALRQYVRFRRTQHDLALERVRKLKDRSQTLIMVATEVERDAVVDAVHAVNHTDPELMFLPHQTVLKLGTVGRTTIKLVHVEQGTVKPGSAISAAALIDRLDPDFLVLTGICYGLEPGEQEIGDILVCDQLRAIEHRKEIDPPGSPQETLSSGREAADRIESAPAPDGERIMIFRGDYVTPSTALLSRLKAVQRTWPSPPKVHVGPMLSGNVLVNSRSLRDWLCKVQPEAVGGEMEGAGVYAASADAKVDWIVVKAISDWGFAKSNEHRALAARNAAAFVIHAAQEGALDDVRVRRVR